MRRARPCSRPRISAGSWATYIIYGPLLAGMATIMYEGTPLRPDAGHLVADRREVQGHGDVLRAPTAVRVLKKPGSAFLKKHDLSSLKHLFLAGEPLDETSPPVDHGANSAFRSSTTTGRPRPAGRCWPSAAASEDSRSSSARPAFPVFGYDLRLFP